MMFDGRSNLQSKVIPIIMCNLEIIAMMHKAAWYYLLIPSNKIKIHWIHLVLLPQIVFYFHKNRNAQIKHPKWFEQEHIMISIIKIISICISKDLFNIYIKNVIIRYISIIMIIGIKGAFVFGNHCSVYHLFWLKEQYV